jgi:hypothetical protein
MELKKGSAGCGLDLFDSRIDISSGTLSTGQRIFGYRVRLGISQLAELSVLLGRVSWSGNELKM